MLTEMQRTEKREEQKNILRWLREKKEAKEKRDMEIRELRQKLALNYRYYRRSGHDKDEPLKNDCVISIGWKVVLDIGTDTTSVQYAVALCGKKDVFSRSEAQNIIDERFDKGYVNEFKIDLAEFPEKTINALIRIHYNAGKNDANKLGIKYVHPKKKDMPAWAKYIP